MSDKIQTSIYLTREVKDQFNQLCKEKHIVGTRLVEEFILNWIKEQKPIKKRIKK